MTSAPLPDTTIDLDSIIVPGAVLSFKGYGSIHGTNYPSEKSWAEFCEIHGFVHSERVTKTKTDALITDSPENDSGREKQAREFGKPIIPMDTFTDWFENRESSAHQEETNPPHTDREVSVETHPVEETAPASAPTAVDNADRPIVPSLNPYAENHTANAPQTRPQPMPQQPPQSQPQHPALPPQPRERKSLWFIAAAIMLILSLISFMFGVNQTMQNSVTTAGPALMISFMALGSGITLVVVNVIKMFRR